MDDSPPPPDADPLEGLEDRLKSHAQAFESLLALTPARDYFGSHAVDGRDPSEQWNRKKQSKEEKRAAKKAKLDPANQKSALDVLKEKEAEALRKRKRKADADEEDGDLDDGKRMKRYGDEDAAEARRREKAEKKKEKRERKKEKKAAKRAKAEAKKSKKQGSDLQDIEVEKQRPEAADDDSESNAEHMEPSEMEAVDFSGLTDGTNENETQYKDEDMTDAVSVSSSAPTTPLESPPFDLATNHSAASSSSSVVPPSVVSKPSKPQAKHAEPAPPPTAATSTQPNPTETQPADTNSGASSPKSKVPRISHAEAQERLRARIEELRAKRKADGPDGQPARSRTELLEERRRSDEKRKQAKKEQRAKEKEDEGRRREEMLRGSGSPLGSVLGSMDMFSPRSPQATNYSFSRLAFQDGSAATADLSNLRDGGKKKGPQDPQTALQAAQAKESRLAGYDASKRADIAEKDSWLNARKKAQGERIRDDTSLLKKALKRKEKQKGKSEQQWKEREDNVVKGREIKQKKRDANLAKRREEKGGKGKKKNKAGAGKGKKVKRPGFEGRFRA